MGRPINYKKIGGATSAEGQQLILSAWFDGEVGPENAYVVKQTASRSFLLAAVADPTRNGVFKLGNAAVEGETAVLEVLPFGKTVPNGFAIATVTVESGGATTELDGEYTLTYLSGDVEPVSGEVPVITFSVAAGVFTNIVEIVDGGRFLTDPTSATLTFANSELNISENPTVTVDTVTALTAPEVENAEKLTQHRVVTFDGNAYKYKVGVAADEDGEADLATA